jgi:hypothetical protein
MSSSGSLRSAQARRGTPARGAGGESGRDDKKVVPQLDALCFCYSGGDPRGDRENELVEVKTVATRFSLSVLMLLPFRSRCTV